MVQSPVSIDDPQHSLFCYCMHSNTKFCDGEPNEKNEKLLKELKRQPETTVFSTVNADESMDQICFHFNNCSYVM